MVKIRTPLINESKDKINFNQQVEKFADGAENQINTLNKNAIRDFKAIRVPFNEFEYQQLAQGAELSGRTKLNFIRYAILQLSKELQVLNKET